MSKKQKPLQSQLPISEPSGAEWELIRPPVLSKPDYARRYKAGEFGNASPTWATLEEFQQSNWGSPGQLYHLRNKVPKGPTHYNLQRVEVGLLWSRSEPQQWYCSAMAPHYAGTIQGEVEQSTRGLDLLWTTAKLPMREALAKQQENLHGLQAVQMLRQFMNPLSLDWLMELLRIYDGHVVEFSCFDRCWGTVPGYNTVYWEVRKY